MTTMPVTALWCRAIFKALPRLARASLPARTLIRIETNEQLAAAAGEDRRTAGETLLATRLFLAEGHLTRQRFGAMLGRIALLPIPTGRVGQWSSRQRNPSMIWLG
jgi:hypothetical protein